MTDYPNLTRVSFTGADDKTDIGALKAFQDEYPEAELAILVIPEATGTPLYPKGQWIAQFARACGGGKTALHLCKEAIPRFIEKDPLVWSLASLFRRVQLNIFQGKAPVDPAALDDAAAEFHKMTRVKRVIVPMNPKNAEMVGALKDPNIQVLFDRSGGKGTIPGDWPQPVAGRTCGYAGGLSPDNIKDQIAKIDAAAGGRAYWIDMQSGVRDDADQFSLTKARKVMTALGF